MGLSQSLIWFCTPNSVPVGRSRQHVANGQSGAGEALGRSKAVSALGGWGSMGLGPLSVTPQAARAPQAMHSPDLPELLPVAFALVSELQLCKSQPFLCPTTMASVPQTVGQHILLWGAVTPLFIYFLLLGRLPQATGTVQQETSTFS